MNINSTENMSQNLASTNTSSQKNDHNRVQDAIDKGTQEGKEEYQYIEIELDSKTKEKLKTIAGAFGSSWDLIIQIAINYAAFSCRKKGLENPDILPLENEEIQNQRNLSRKTSKKIRETVELKDKLKALNCQDKPSECVKLGVALLYKNNIEDE